MNLKTLNLKLVLGTIYLLIIAVGLYFLFTFVDLRDLGSYEFIRSNKDLILKFKNENFLLLAFSFFTFSVIWTLLLGFATPILLFAGFVFGKWWGILLVLVATTIGATLLYLLATLFFKDFIESKLAPKFIKLKNFFNKNDIIYFMCYRFVGGGGTPYSIQNILPTLFGMPVKNYIIATFIGSAPAMFVTVSLGSGIESVIEQNAELSFSKVLFSPEIYIPIGLFFVILIFAFVIKKYFFKQ